MHGIKTPHKDFWLSTVCDENGRNIERVPRPQGARPLYRPPLPFPPWLPREIRRVTLDSSAKAVLAIGIGECQGTSLDDALEIVGGLKYEMIYDRETPPRRIYLQSMEKVARPQNDATAAGNAELGEIRSTMAYIADRKRVKDRKAHQPGPRSRAKWKGYEREMTGAVSHARKYLNRDWREKGIKRGGVDAAIEKMKEWAKNSSTEFLKFLGHQNKLWLWRRLTEDGRRRRG